jgi:hypothetical protein
MPNAIVIELNDDLGQWIICPACLTADAAWDGICGCGKEMVRVYSEGAIERAQQRLERSHSAA